MTSEPDDTPATVLSKLETVLNDRRQDAPPESYSAPLVRDSARAARKFGEEALELSLELGREQPDPQRVTEEAADTLFGLLCGLVAAGVPLESVTDELADRRGDG